MTASSTQKSAAATVTAPTPPELPPAPSGDFWTPTQWAVLLSLIDAFIPSVVSDQDPRAVGGRAYKAVHDSLEFDRDTHRVVPQKELEATITKARRAFRNPPDADLVAEFLADRPSDNPLFLDSLKRTAAGTSQETRKQLGTVLGLLATWPGSLVLTGSRTPVHKQTLAAREAVIKSWANSCIADLRKLVRGISALAQTSYLISAPLFRQVSGYADVPPNWRAGDVPEFEFIQFPPAVSLTSAPEVIETDVVIVGSGCGGAVAAQLLSAAGHKVIVVDKSYHYPQNQLPLPQEAGARLLFENNGVLASTDPCVTVLAGATWGGGGTINWSVCLKPPSYVRSEWSTGGREPGMAFIQSAGFDASLDRVIDFMGCNDATPQHLQRPANDPDGQSHRGRVLIDGAKKLKFQSEPLLQNGYGGEPHDCGYCHLGCSSADKRGTSVSWLPDAAENGATFIEGFQVERVLFDKDDGRSSTTPTKILPPSVYRPKSKGTPKATGIVGTWLSRSASGSTTAPESERTKRRVVIKAKKVIVAGGSLWSPVLLLKSGLTNPQIGKNLHLHPCTMVAAYFDEETRPMDKGIITSLCTSFEDLDGKGHGPRLEATCMVPYAILSNLPWNDGLDFKTAIMRHRHLDGFISLTRDRDSGRVFPDPNSGQPVVDYKISPLDRENALEGAIGIARLCRAQKANEIRVYVAGSKPYIRNKAQSRNQDEATFEKWVDHIRDVGMSMSSLWGGWTVGTPFASAHQMGTCRMGDDKGAKSVVDPRGRVWGTEGLYVADASVFPSASGVNPMVTVMALADWIAQGVSRDLKRA